MAKHNVVCLYCGQTFDASIEEYVKPRSNRYAHKKCAEESNNRKTKEEKDKEQLEEYIKKLFSLKSLTPRINQQIKSFHEKQGYSYSGMWKSLKYFYEIKGNSIEKSNGGIGIIPFIYDEAYTYWRGIWETQQENTRITEQIRNVQTRKIRIKSPYRRSMKSMRDLFTFLEDDENEQQQLR